MYNVQVYALTRPCSMQTLWWFLKGQVLELPTGRNSPERLTACADCNAALTSIEFLCQKLCLGLLVFSKVARLVSLVKPRRLT